MASLIYALSGEGRGHATRARAVIDELRAEHRVVVYTYGQGAELLTPIYRGTEVELREVPGLRFCYSQRGTLDYLRTGLATVPFLRALPEQVSRLCRELQRTAPELVITDFEPLLPRAAAQLGVPFVSLDHQHFLLAYDLRALPLRLQLYARWLAPWVALYYRGQVHSIVSSFYSAPLSRRCSNVTRVGVLLRREVLRAEPVDGSHVLLYVRRHVTGQLLSALQQCGREVRVYGLGPLPRMGRVSFHAVHPTRFTEDLASCAALVCTAGNQLVGEALYLKKPVLALPEAGNFEQEINGHFLAHSGMGESLPMHALTPGSLRGFLRRVPALRERIDPGSVCGNAATLSVLRQQLAAAAAPRHQAVAVPS